MTQFGYIAQKKLKEFFLNNFKSEYMLKDVNIIICERRYEKKNLILNSVSTIRDMWFLLSI